MEHWRLTFLTAGLITIGMLAVLLFTSLSGSFKSLMIGQFTYSIMGILLSTRKTNVASFDPKTMQNAMGSGAGEVILYAFDLLEHDGLDLRGLPLIKRKEFLVSLLSIHKGGAGRLMLGAAIRSEGAREKSAAAPSGLTPP